MVKETSCLSHEHKIINSFGGYNQMLNIKLIDIFIFGTNFN